MPAGRKPLFQESRGEGSIKVAPGGPTIPVQTSGVKKKDGGLQPSAPLLGGNTLPQELETPPPYPQQPLYILHCKTTSPIGAKEGVEEKRGGTSAPSQGAESRDYTPPEGARDRRDTD